LPKKLCGTVSAIPSKSQAHRALICAALADKPTRIECSGVSEDIIATADCLSALGAKIERDQDGFNILPINKLNKNNKLINLNCGESGSTFRFLLPITCALGLESGFILKGRLSQRPLSPLYEELINHGCNLSPQKSNPFYASGNLLPGKYILDAGVSSQFISGLLFALPLLDGDSELRLTGNIESLPYINLTMEMLELFGINISFDGEVFNILGNQDYKSPGLIKIEGDWSNAAFWLSAGAIGSENVTCTGLDLNSSQGDKLILDILNKFGGEKLNGIEIDARDIPDLVPVLAVVGAIAQGTTVISGASRLRGKESDRLAAINAMLKNLGADISETNDGLIINGGNLLKGGEVSACGDHRIAMAAAVAATVCENPVLIRGADAVNKSYPGFFEDFRVLGGRVEIKF